MKSIMRICPTNLFTKALYLVSLCFPTLQKILSIICSYIEDMLSGPICAMVWEGRSSVKTGRGMLIDMISVLLASQCPNISTDILGATNPLASNPGTIRGDYAIV